METAKADCNSCAYRSCNCAGFQYNGSAGNPHLNYYVGAVPGNMQSGQVNTYCYNPNLVQSEYRKGQYKARKGNNFACVV